MDAFDKAKGKYVVYLLFIYNYYKGCLWPVRFRMLYVYTYEFFLFNLHILSRHFIIKGNRQSHLLYICV